MLKETKEGFDALMGELDKNITRMSASKQDLKEQEAEMEAGVSCNNSNITLKR
jgi:hypothetical protein